MVDDRYAAGLFDGEGYVRIAVWNKPNSRHVRYQVIGGIGVTFRPAIEWLRDEYGGSMTCKKRQKKGHRNIFYWHIASQIAASFFRRIQPYLIIKADEVKLALQLQDHIDTFDARLKEHRGNPEIMAYRAKLADQIRRLKTVGFSPLN